MREHSREVIAARRDVRQSERALRKLLQSENLTREELEVGLAEMRRSTADYHELIHEVGIDVLLSLDPKQRMKAAPYLFKQPGRQRGARQGGQDGKACVLKATGARRLDKRERAIKRIGNSNH